MEKRFHKLKKDNLNRLLAPRHIAFIGGSDADFSARQCAKYFPGKIWGVNPKRKDMGGNPCLSSVKELPEAPDAVYLATPRNSTLQVVKELNEIGAGGVVCFTAGYGELGEQGKKAEQELVSAAGDLALVGPNCYGLISYVHKAVMWPFGAGECNCDKGVALIMQSGMMSANLALNQRSVPLAYVVSAGNQGMLAIEDYIDFFVDDLAVTAMGVYIEGIVDIEKFGRAALRALQVEKPIVLIKAGKSTIGSLLTVSHTGSLSGSEQNHQALFDQVGIVTVDSPESLLETLKFMTVSGIPKGKRIYAFSCSGGDAALVADYCEKKNLELPQPSANSELENLLPDIATISNPLDYTTPLWGNTEVMPKVFSAALKDGFDAAIFIQDYPPPEVADNALYLKDGESFMQATHAANIPAAICSEISENINKTARNIMIESGVAPLQGIDRGLDAISLACNYNDNRNRILNSQRDLNFQLVKSSSATEKLSNLNSRVLNEWECKMLLKNNGVTIPTGMLFELNEGNQAAEYAKKIGFPVVAKLVADELPHKSDYGFVSINLESLDDVELAIKNIQSQVKKNPNGYKIQGILIESMVEDAISELLIGVKSDNQFGLVMVIASGGIFVELYKDAQSLLLPTDREGIMHSLTKLQSYPLLCGYRGKEKCDLDSLAETILGIASFAESRSDFLLELDINPLIILPNLSIMVDALIRERWHR